MKFHALMIGAATMALGTAAFAQDNPTGPMPGARPAPTMQPATPMPPPPTEQPSTTTPPSQPDTSPAKPDSMAKPDPTMAKPAYGMGWDAKKCAAAEQKGKADPANCPKPEPKS